MSDYALLSNLARGFNTVRVFVRVVRFYFTAEDGSADDVAAFNMVFIDEEGTKVCGVCSADSFLRFMGYVVEGGTYMIQNFYVNDNSSFAVDACGYNVLEFNEGTIISRSNGVITASSYAFVPIRDIMAEEIAEARIVGNVILLVVIVNSLSYTSE